MILNKKSQVMCNLILCPVCKSNNIIIFFTDNRNRFELLKCNECKLQFKRSANKINYENLDFDDYSIYNFSRKNEVKDLIKILKSYDFENENLSVLEIGCGTGSLLNEFHNYGIHKLYGIEPSQVACDYAKETFNLNIINGYFSHNSLSEKVDIIILYDVIEHLNKPHALFYEIGKYMTKDTLLLIKTGNTSSLNAKVSKSHWRYYQGEQHVVFYNKKSLKNLLNQHNLEIVNFYFFKHAYGGVHLRFFLKKIIKGLIVRVLFWLNLYVNKNNSYSVALVNDHFIAAIRKKHIG
ncbi:MAG: class I SAM-dependent methyltransferase [candidate division KSB1 bacterium]|nr:class I SAM-dependent methyltransferase [candidate division KSB1 bacterium]